MTGRFLLHAFTPLPNVSPFDVNMAHDAGFDAVTPYTNLALADVRPLTQDVIFSRSPADAARTGIFIGGRDAGLALDMLAAAQAAMLPPFEVSVFADPAGAFTTAAAMVAVVDKHLRALAGGGLAGRTVAVFGANGVVGGVAAVLAARAGAEVLLVSHRADAKLEAKLTEFRHRFGTAMRAVDGVGDAAKTAVVRAAEVVLCCARAGVRVLDGRHLAGALDLRVVADINAVPPAGVEGIEATADGVPLAGTGAVGIGALAVGNIKFKTQHDLFQAMRTSPRRLYLSFPDAFDHARALAG